MKTPHYFGIIFVLLASACGSEKDSTSSGSIVGDWAVTLHLANDACGAAEWLRMPTEDYATVWSIARGDDYWLVDENIERDAWPVMMRGDGVKFEQATKEAGMELWAVARLQADDDTLRGALSYTLGPSPLDSDICTIVYAVGGIRLGGAE